MKSKILLVCASVLGTILASSEIRNWKDATGLREANAELVGREGDEIQLKKADGHIITSDLQSLSRAYQAFLASDKGTGVAGNGAWPQWQGAHRDNISLEKMAQSWPADGPKELWASHAAGLGYSSFSVSGDFLYTMGLFDAEEKALCLSTKDGSVIWETTVGPIYRNGWGDGPRSTPTIVGGKLVILSGTGVVACLNRADGNLIWSKNLEKDLGGSMPSWGYTESPLVDGELVLVTPGGENGAIAALDLHTGQLVWQSAELKDSAQYSSLVAFEHEGKRQVVQLFSRSFAGVAVQDGALLWRADFNGQTAVIPTPIYHNNQVYVVAGYGVGCKKISLGGKQPKTVYENDVIVNHHGGVVLVGGHIYGHSDSGGWTCQDFETGEKVWQTDQLGKGCLTCVGGMLICLEEENGKVVLVEATKEGWKEQGHFTMTHQSDQRSSQGRIWTHPVVADGKLYLRDQEWITCYDVKP